LIKIKKTLILSLVRHRNATGSREEAGGPGGAPFHGGEAPPPSSERPGRPRETWTEDPVAWRLPRVPLSARGEGRW
jgi:hypothetical protein